MGKQFIFCMLMSLLSDSAEANRAGVREGGGGNSLSAEFAATAREAIDMIGLGDPDFDKKAAFESVKSIKVIPVEKLCFSSPIPGQEYCEDAHYDAATNTVMFNFKNWDNLSCSSKLAIAAHEFLRAAGLEGGDYAHSGRLLSREIVQCNGPLRDLKRADECITASNEIELKRRRVCSLLEDAKEFRKTTGKYTP